ncbi:DNA primase family protein [Alicyclobacillus dauci]|uniref:Phage/plasmid primase, P4 family n=1 Tax=Alicyclobacillus dauci TaxID=1475485 RepID=A0ABY6Z4U7_9BACL|nr:phage/plasmid primase, P4 family [Alicyclobacillus dauci]WAH37040.1 phage/plasmid primase, P4 family [Alicyclobacillus dauci]
MPRKLLTDAQLGILQVMSSRQQGGIDPNSGLPMGFYTSMIDLFNPSQPAKSLKIAELKNKLVNTFADLPRTSMSNSSNFKAIVSGDSINAERKFKEPFDFRPFAKLVFSTNEFPRNADITDGFFRRWLIIPFEKKFTPDKADVKLIDRLTTPSALSTLLNYALEGLRRLETNGKFTECETITNAVKKYRDAYDTVKVFIDECCAIGEQLSCLKDDLYAQYQVWSQKSGLKPYGKIKFNERIAKQYQDTRIKGESNWRWVGINLKQA